jgi:hypothetical protein
MGIGNWCEYFSGQPTKFLNRTARERPLPYEFGPLHTFPDSARTGLAFIFPGSGPDRTTQTRASQRIREQRVRAGELLVDYRRVKATSGVRCAFRILRMIWTLTCQTPRRSLGPGRVLTVDNLRHHVGILRLASAAPQRKHAACHFLSSVSPGACAFNSLSCNHRGNRNRLSATNANDATEPLALNRLIHFFPLRETRCTCRGHILRPSLGYVQRACGILEKHSRTGLATNRAA